MFTKCVIQLVECDIAFIFSLHVYLLTRLDILNLLWVLCEFIG